MKNILFILLLTFFGCSKYQVVSKVRVNLYHLHNPKTNDVELILTKELMIERTTVPDERNDARNIGIKQEVDR